jgi:hypothetical protein
MAKIDKITKLTVGFTGTQRGMTSLQIQSIVSQLSSWSKKYHGLEIHHGDCIGADHQFHQLCLEYWQGQVQVILHPPKIEDKRAFSESPHQQTLPVQDYLLRNHAIVEAVDCMIAAPGEANEKLRSGTWATIRHSRKHGVPLKVFFPQ